MHLAEIEYHKNGAPKKRIFILLDEEDSKFICVASDMLSIDEVEAIKQNMRHLRKLPLRDKARWLKFNIPSYKKAYRTINKSHARIIKLHKVN